MPDLSKLEEHIEALVRVAQESYTCVTCEHFSMDTEGCALAGGARPPARVIAFGCDKYNQVPPF